MKYKKHLLILWNLSLLLWLALALEPAEADPWNLNGYLSLNGSFQVNGKGSLDRSLNVAALPGGGLAVRMSEGVFVAGYGRDSLDLLNPLMGLSLNYRYEGSLLTGSRAFTLTYGPTKYSTSSSVFYIGKGRLGLSNLWQIPSSTGGKYYEEQWLSGDFTMVHVAEYDVGVGGAHPSRPTYIPIFP